MNKKNRSKIMKLFSFTVLTHRKNATRSIGLNAYNRHLRHQEENDYLSPELCEISRVYFHLFFILFRLNVYNRHLAYVTFHDSNSIVIQFRQKIKELLRHLMTLTFMKVVLAATLVLSKVI